MSDSSTGALRFEMLGPVRAYRGAEPVDLGPPLQQAVLAVLLLHAGKPVPVRQIVAALWSGDPPANGVDAVQRCVGALRRALDPQRTSLIALTGDGYVLRVGEQAVDTGLFRAALARARAEHRTGEAGAATGEVRDALARWPERPLAGLTGPVFESARARLDDDRAAAAELLARPARTAPIPPERARDPIPADPDPVPVSAPRGVEPFRAESDLEPFRATRAVEPVSAPRGVEPFRAEPDPEPNRATRAIEPISAEPATARTGIDPTRLEPPAARPAYPEPTDPWAGHDLFPPDPLALG